MTTGTTRLGLRLLMLLAVVLFPLEALATTITDGGLEDGYGCQSPYFLCTGTSKTFSYDSPSPFAAASGNVNLDIGNLLLDLDIYVASATFAATSASDNGIDEIIFTSLNYSATGLSITDIGGGVYQVGGSVTVTGFYQQLFGGNEVVASTAFSSGAKVNSALCTESGGALNCALSFGHGQFQLDVGAAPEARRFQHTFNVLATPEPGSLVLLSGGLAGLLVARRRVAAVWNSR